MEINSRYFIRNVTITQVWNGAAVAGGVVFDALLLAFVGISSTTDALFAALTIPLFLSQVTESAAPKVLVPIFSRNLEDDGQNISGVMYSKTVNAFAIVFTVIAAVLLPINALLLPAIVPGLPDEVISLAVNLSRWLLVLIPTRAVIQLMRTALNTQHKYGLAGAVRLVGNGVAIVVLVCFFQEWGIYSVALALLCSDVAQIAALSVGLHKLGCRYNPLHGIDMAQIREIVANSILPASGDMLRGSRTFFENFAASFIGPGSLSLLRYSYRILNGVGGVALGAVGVVTLPSLSRRIVSGGESEMKRVLIKSLKMQMFISALLIAWLGLAGQPFIALMFTRGEFSAENARTMGQLIAIMIPGLCVARANALVAGAFYSIGEYTTAFWINMIYLGCYLGISFLLVPFLGLFGFAIGFLVAPGVSMVILQRSFRRKFGSLGWGALADFARRLLFVVVSIAAMYLVITGALFRLSYENLESRIISFALTSGFLMISFFVGCGIAGILRRPMLASVFKRS